MKNKSAIILFLLSLTLTTMSSAYAASHEKPAAPAGEEKPADGDEEPDCD